MKKQFFVWGLLVGVMVLLVHGARGGNKNELESIIPAPRAKAEELGVSRFDPKWIDDYCQARIVEVGTIPTVYERRRGPTKTLAPLFRSWRYEGAREKAVCNLDYYIQPKAKEVFGQVGVEYRYSKAVWEQFHQSMSASVSARLKAENWQVVSPKKDEKNVPKLMLARHDLRMNLWEYLDMFFTNDEEIVFELLVVSNE